MRGQLMAWVYFAFVQLVSFIAMVIGWIVLIPFCLARAWTLDQNSLKDQRPVDRWTWPVLNIVYGNREDGVSGQTALIWVDDVLSPYMPNAWAPWRAYCWSAWRNSADGLKYLFAWSNGPIKEFTVFGTKHKIGWQLENGLKVPVLS